MRKIAESEMNKARDSWKAQRDEYERKIAALEKQFQEVKIDNEQLKFRIQSESDKFQMEIHSKELKIKNLLSMKKSDEDELSQLQRTDKKDLRYQMDNEKLQVDIAILQSEKECILKELDKKHKKSEGEKDF